LPRLAFDITFACREPKHGKWTHQKNKNRRKQDCPAKGKMKNKVVSAMLVGMSVTMAMPGATIFAAEDTSAMEEVTAGGQADDTSGDTAGQLSEGGVTEPEGTAEPEEAAAAEDEIPTPEEMTADMVAYASDEAAKVADTPSDFSSKLASLSFDKAVFGKYATSFDGVYGKWSR